MGAVVAAPVPDSASNTYAAQQVRQSKTPPPAQAVTEPDIAELPPQRWCEDMQRAKGVKPGKSWGSLSQPQIEDWKRKRCDQFFCEPNAMEARGTYTCVPINKGARTAQ